MGILGIEKSSPAPLVSNMVILRNYLPEGRELEEDMGRESGIRYEGTGNRESQGIKRWARGEGRPTSAALIHGIGPPGPILALRGRHIPSIFFPAGAEALTHWGNGR